MQREEDGKREIGRERLIERERERERERGRKRGREREGTIANRVKIGHRLPLSFILL